MFFFFRNNNYPQHPSLSGALGKTISFVPDHAILNVAELPGINTTWHES